MYKSEWLGSVDPDVLAGKGAFTVGEETVVLDLESLRQFQDVGNMISAAYTCGAQEALDRIEIYFARTIQEIRVISVWPI